MPMTDMTELLAGVIPARTKDEALRRIKDMMLDFKRNHDNWTRKKVAELAVNGHETSEKLWAQVTEIANQIGGQFYNKPPKGWKEFWDKIRLDTKATLATYFKKVALTGNVPVDQLDNFTWHVGFLYGFAGIGLNIGTESGIGPESMERHLLCKQIFEAKRRELDGYKLPEMSTRARRKFRSSGKSSNGLAVIPSTPINNTLQFIGEHFHEDPNAASPASNTMVEEGILSELDEQLRYLRSYRESVDEATAKKNESNERLRHMCSNYGVQHKD